MNRFLQHYLNGGVPKLFLLRLAFWIGHKRTAQRLGGAMAGRLVGSRFYSNSFAQSSFLQDSEEVLAAFGFERHASIFAIDRLPGEGPGFCSRCRWPILPRHSAPSFDAMQAFVADTRAVSRPFYDGVAGWGVLWRMGAVVRARSDVWRVFWRVGCWNQRRVRATLILMTWPRGPFFLLCSPRHRDPGEPRCRRD